MAGRVFAITGAFGALGSAVARAAAAQGARIALIDYASQAPSGLPKDALVLPGIDLTDAVAAAAAIDAVADRFGGLDALLNIAGGFAWETVAGGSSESWYSLYRLNVLTATNASRAAIPIMRSASWIGSASSSTPRTCIRSSSHRSNVEDCELVARTHSGALCHNATICGSRRSYAERPQPVTCLCDAAKDVSV